MSYTADAAGALADVTAAGSAVTFTKITPGVYNAATDTWTDAVDLTVTGYAIEVGKNPLIYQALNLILSDAPTLLFTPTTYGAAPALGATVVWGGISFTVRSIVNLAPDGTVILSRCVVSR